jgi:hypothetical protein
MTSVAVLRPLNDDELQAMTFIELGRALRASIAAKSAACDQARRIRAELARRPDPDEPVTIQESFDVV